MPLGMTAPHVRPLSLRLLTVALAAWCGILTSASAQTADPWAGIAPPEQEEQAPPEETTPSSDTSAAIETVTPDIDWDALNADFANVASKQAKLKQQKAAELGKTDPWSWTRSNNADGSAAVAIKQPIT